MSSHHGSNYYKDQCHDLKHDLKRKRRELEEAEERCRRSDDDSKKAKVEAQEMLKLYQGIQRELQLAYERNAKLQVDKCSFEALLDSERKEFETYKRHQTSSAEESSKLKEALCAMRIEKSELEAKFNAIVMENKDLRDRARQYEPRLREMEEMKKKMAQLEQMINDQMQPEIREQNECAQRAQVRQEQMDRYAKWNDLLRRECEEKNKQLQMYDDLVELAKNLEKENSKWKSELQQLKSQSTVDNSNASSINLIMIRSELHILRDRLFGLRTHFQSELAICTDQMSAIMDCVKNVCEIICNRADNSVIEIGSAVIRD